MAYRKFEKESDEILYGADLSIGEFVIADKGKPNSSTVKIVEFSPKRIFSVVVGNNGLSWTIMTKRLTKNND